MQYWFLQALPTLSRFGPEQSGTKKMPYRNIGLSINPTAERTAFLTLALRSLARALMWPVRVYRARQTLHQLSSMDARELRDIGLTPYDVQSAQALPMDADPTKLLAHRARERARNAVTNRIHG